MDPAKAAEDGIAAPLVCKGCGRSWLSLGPMAGRKGKAKAELYANTPVEAWWQGLGDGAPVAFTAPGSQPRSHRYTRSRLFFCFVCRPAKQFSAFQRLQSEDQL